LDRAYNQTVRTGISGASRGPGSRYLGHCTTIRDGLDWICRLIYRLYEREIPFQLLATSDGHWVRGTRRKPIDHCRSNVDSTRHHAESPGISGSARMRYWLGRAYVGGFLPHARSNPSRQQYGYEYDAHFY
jgi:hypothetical protein